jgi:hypothetical protein
MANAQGTCRSREHAVTQPAREGNTATLALRRAWNKPTQAPKLPVLSRIEAYADVEFTSDDMAAVAQEAAMLLHLAKGA